MKTTTMIQGGAACVVAAIALGAALLAADNNPKPKRAATQAFMRQKLLYSQLALEGLTLEKFELVSKNAVRMRDMTQSNQWFTLKQPDYLVHTTNFHRRVDALYMAAVDKKLDAATEAYVNVTRSCVECHRLVRAAQRRNAGTGATEIPGDRVPAP